jgi:hypothetical protein
MKYRQGARKRPVDVLSTIGYSKSATHPADITPQGFPALACNATITDSTPFPITPRKPIRPPAWCR